MSTPEYDEWLLETSSAGAEDTPMPFKSRSKITINDSNNGQYSNGQITWDLSQLANSTNMPDLRAAYLRIPYQMKLSALTAAGLPSPNAFDVSAAGASAYAMCFKGSNLSTIDSLTLEISNQNVVSLQQLSNIPITYDLLTKWNDNDVNVLGPTINFEKDTSGSVRWDQNVGETNNSITSVAPSGLNPEACNLGKLRRSQRSMTSALNTTFAQYNDQTALNEVELSNVVESGAGFTYTVFATIPLRYLHDVFAKLPLVKGAQYKLTVNTHAPCSFTETVGAAAAVSAPVAVSQKGFIPFMIPQPSTGNSANGLRVIPANMEKLVAELSIKSTCVFHCNMMELTPLYAQVYFKNPVKTVKFMDFLTNRSIIDVGPGQSVSQFQLTPGLGRLRKLLIVPIVSASANAAIDPLQSANTSCGMTCAPFAYMSQFQVILSGQNLFAQPIQYRYDNFLQEQFGVNALDGNATEGLRTGLISEFDFNTSYGYVNINLSRKFPEADEIPKAVSVSFQNRSLKKMNYITYLYYERSISIDCLSGQIVI